MSDLVPEGGNLARDPRRPWEAPILSVLNFRATAGTQQAGADNPQVASFTQGTSNPSGPPGPPADFPAKSNLACDGAFPSATGNFNFFGASKGGLGVDVSLCTP
jgi:hypothetical protein